MKKIIILLVMTLFAFNSCKKTEKNENPFLNDKYDTPFEVPPFEKIRAAHFKPAYLKGFEEQKKVIREIIINSDKPSFANTIKALEYSGEMLTKVQRVFGALNSANTNDTLQALNKELSPLISKHRDDINLNDSLFRKVKSVYENKDKFTLTDEEKKLLDDTYKDFVRSGAALSAGDKDKLRKINKELSLLSVQFSENLLAETNGFKLVIDKKEDLAGLPDGVIAQAATMAKNQNLEGKWVFTLQVPSMYPFLQYSEKRDLREKLFTGYFMKGDNDNARDNKAIIAKIAKLRVERCNLLGYKNFADFTLEMTMAKTSEKVFGFLNQVWDAALPVAKAEAKAQQELIDREGGKFKLAPWDCGITRIR
jgi:peptidyl-dipeptidase Dcp